MATSIAQFLAPDGDSIPDSEREARRIYFDSPVTVRGRVLGEDGQPVSGASVLIAERSTISADDGRFEIAGLTRRNSLFSVKKPQYRTHLAGLELSVPLAIGLVEVPDVQVAAEAPDVVRLLFGGDTSFARRFLDPLERFDRSEIPENNPDALIQVSDPLVGSRNVLSRIAPLFEVVDFPVVNLETVVTRNPNTPHMEKDYAYFSLPESLPALTGLGIRYVSLGNNHVYDYLEQGLADTLAYVAAAGMNQSGAGINAAEAFKAYRVDLGGHPYSFLSMSSVSGEQFTISYNATEDKGGAADLRQDDAVVRAIQQEVALQRLPIAILHTGREYSFQPSDFVLDRLELVAAQQPALIIGHHPHVAQGFGFHSGVLAVHSLGNLLFDQLRLETMLSMLVQIDIRGRQVGAVRAIPIYIEDSVPRLLVGANAGRLLRRIAELSAPHGARVMPYAGWGWVSAAADAAPAEIRTTTIDVEVSNQGFTIVDLRALEGSDEALARVHLPANTSGSLGRDILAGYGDFEDIDVDDEIFELSRWDVTGASSFPCLSRVFRGAGALCLVRSAGQSSDSVVPLRNRIRVLGDSEHAPNKNLSLFAYIKGENAGKFRIDSRYYASLGDNEFGEETAIEQGEGNYEWKPVCADLTMPPDDPKNPESYALNARALRVFIHEGPPSQGEGLVAIDELAVINWDLSLNESTPNELQAPHAREFLRLNAQPGRYQLTLEFRGL